jgi:hypothetical protein
MFAKDKNPMSYDSHNTNPLIVAFGFALVSIHYFESKAGAYGNEVCKTLTNPGCFSVRVV